MKKSSTLIFLILGALVTISPFSIDMYLPAFQQIAADLHTSVERVSFSLSSYFIGLAFGQILYGPLLDRYGRKRPLYYGLGLYILSSIACLFSSNIEVLILFRFFQAIGGCAAGVASMAMVRDFYPLEENAKVFSNLMLILSVSPLFAPTVGSFVSTTFGWHAVFISLTIIVALILLAVIFLLPEGHEPDTSVLLDPKSIYQNLKSIFHHPQFFAFAFAGGFSFSGLFGYIGGSAPLFMGTFHLSAKEFGAVFAFLSVGIVGGGQVNNFLLRRFSSGRIFKTALRFQLILSCVFLVASFTPWFGLFPHILLLFLCLSCAGLTYPNAAALCLAPFEKNAGSAASLLGFLQMSIGAVASACFGLINQGPSRSIGILFVLAAGTGFIFMKLSASKSGETRNPLDSATKL